MKHFVSLLFSSFILCTQLIGQASVENYAYPADESLEFSNLTESEVGQTLLDKYPVLKNYVRQKSSEYTIQQRELSRMPNIGLSYETNKETKTSYVPNDQNGWYFPDHKYYVGIYGKHIRKNKEKKGNRHIEQRIYRIEKMKAISHVDVLFDSPAWLEEIYNVRQMKNGKAVIVGCAALFSDRNDDLNKRILFFDNDMNLMLDKTFKSRQKKMFIYDIITNGTDYTVLNSSSAGFLKKGDGEAKYEVNIFNKEIATTAMFDLSTEYIAVKRMEFRQIVKMDDNSTLLIGNLIYIDANHDSNPEKRGNLIYVHLDAAGKLITSKSYPVKLHSEPYLYYSKTVGDNSLFVFGNSNKNEDDLLLQVNRSTGKISTHSSYGKPLERFVHVDKKTKEIIYFSREAGINEVKVIVCFTSK